MFQVQFKTPDQRNWRNAAIVYSLEAATEYAEAFIAQELAAGVTLRYQVVPA